MLVHFEDLDPRKDDYATKVVDRLLHAAVNAGASDIHVDAAAVGVNIQWRVFGNLIALGIVPDGATTSILGRIKALARLITYRQDIPQEGRISIAHQKLEARVGTLPTLHGERAVIRIVAKHTHDWLPTQLGLAADALQAMIAGLQERSGVILIAGMAGSGKTTTAYACLRELLQQAGTHRSVVCLEDPIETEIQGAVQSQINPNVGFDWSAGLKTLLRQDPEVMFVGEIREPETAAVVFQAAMTGQLVITTMHARSTADAIRRLLDMQVPAYHLRSALHVLLCQRLVRKRCSVCEVSVRSRELSNTCPACAGTGSVGRVLLAELFPKIEGELGRAILQDFDTPSLSRLAQSLGMRSLATLAADAVSKGEIHANEIRH